MIVTRRRFFRDSALLAVVGSSLASTACWISQNVFKQISAYVGIGLQAVASVVSILAGAGTIPIGEGTAINAVLVLIKAAFADLQTAVTAYENAPADQKATLLGKVSTALADVQANIQQFWNDIKIPDVKLEALVEGLLGVVLTTLAGFAASLPAPAPTPVQMKAKALRRTISVTPQKRTIKAFKHDFNKLLNDNGYSKLDVK